MVDRLHHRGPDSAGYHEADGAYLGMRRLAVVDPESSNQPIYNETSDIGVVFNGEIYNFRSLRETLGRRGHLFRTHGDTEVLPHLYEEHGPECFGELNGMFAVALHDVRRRRVVLARDPHGIKPLFWTYESGRLRFASEIKALFADPSLSREPDFEAIVDYLTHWYVPTPRSAFRGVWKLPPGHVLVFEPGQSPRVFPYRRRSFACGGDGIDSFPDAVSACTRAIRDAVERHLVADVPVGVFLSGGLDSSLISTVAASLAGRRLRAFTIAFPNHGSYDEAPVASSVAAAAGLEHVVIPFPADPEPLVRSALQTFDEPFGDYSAVAMTLLAREARQYATVCLAGDGGDEVFAGYTHYKAPPLAGFYSRLPAFTRNAIEKAVFSLPTSFERISLDYMARRFVRAATNPPLTAHLLYKAIFFGSERAALLGPRLAEFTGRDVTTGLEQALTHAKTTSPPLVRQLMVLDRLSFMLDDDLVKVDRTSMASSLEVRLPLLDHVVVDTADHVPAQFHCHARTTKRILRSIASQCLPPHVARLKKRGFTPPMPYWLAGPLARVMNEHLSSEAVRRAGLVLPEFVARLRHEHESRRRDRTRELWTLLSLHEWWHRHGF